MCQPVAVRLISLCLSTRGEKMYQSTCVPCVCITRIGAETVTVKDFHRSALIGDSIL